MTYRIIGPACSMPGCAVPVQTDGLCSRHFRLAAAFGRSSEPEVQPEPRIVILDHRSYEFSVELNKWRDVA